MSQVVTNAGEALFAQKAQANEQLDIDTFIFAYVPGQDSQAPVDRSEGLPPTAQQVHTQPVQQVGRINNNTVVYSTVLNSLTGPFEFNWVGLYSSVNNTLVAISHVKSVNKTITELGNAGNTLNRNFAIEYSGISDITGITVAPETWQLDFSARLAGMDELTQNLAMDMNGRDWFIGDGFKVEPTANDDEFRVVPGVGYVHGMRVELEQDYVFTVQNYPQYVYVDVWYESEADSKWGTKLIIKTSSTNNLNDFSMEERFTALIAKLITFDAVDDLRADKGLKQELNEHIEKEFNAHLSSSIQVRSGLSLKEDIENKELSSLFSYLVPNTNVYPKNRSLTVGDIIPNNITHLIVNGAAYKQVPTRSGVVSSIIDGQVQVGSIKCNLINEALLNKSTPASKISKNLRDGIAIKIACYGDSTMWGATVGDLETQNPNNAPAMLNEALKSIYGAVATVYNRAVSGTTIRGMLSGGDGSGSTFAEKLSNGGLDEDADVIFCNHGTNDATGDLEIGQYKSDLETFISLCRAKNIVPILVTPNPKTFKLPLVDENKMKRLQHYVKAMRDVAESCHVDLVDQYDLFAQSILIYPPKVTAPDGVHLSSFAYRQSGFNLAIPLVNCVTLSNDGDVATLNQTSWSDNLSKDRELKHEDTSPSGFSIFAKRETNTGINIPFIMGIGRKSVDVCALRWSNGTVMNTTINKVGISQPLNFEVGAGSTSYINYGSRTRLKFNFYAGLQVLGLTFDDTQTGVNDQFAFSGLAIGQIGSVRATKVTGTNTAGTRIGYFEQVIIPSFNFNAGGEKLIFADLGGNDAVEIYVSSANILTIEVNKNGVVIKDVVIKSAFDDGIYPVNFNFDGSKIQLNVGVFFKEIEIEGMPELFIKTANVVYDLQAY